MFWPRPMGSQRPQLAFIYLEEAVEVLQKRREATVVVNDDQVIVVAHGTSCDDANVVLGAARASTYQNAWLVLGEGFRKNRRSEQRRSRDSSYRKQLHKVETCTVFGIGLTQLRKKNTSFSVNRKNLATVPAACRKHLCRGQPARQAFQKRLFETGKRPWSIAVGAPANRVQIAGPSGPTLGAGIVSR